MVSVKPERNHARVLTRFFTIYVQPNGGPKTLAIDVYPLTEARPIANDLLGQLTL